MAYILIVDSQAEFRQELLRLLEQAGHAPPPSLLSRRPPTYSRPRCPTYWRQTPVLTDGSSASLANQAKAAGAKILMMTGNPDRIIEYDGAGQPYLSKPFQPEAFLQRVGEMPGAG